MEINTQLIGMCGLFCGACDNYRAFRQGGEHLLQTEKFKGEKADAEYCEGCNSDILSEHCDACKIRKCAKQKAFMSCAYCDDFPCTKISDFKRLSDTADGAKHRKDINENIRCMRASGKESWVESQINRWTCECGQPYTFYETLCQYCGKKVHSYRENQE